MRRNDFINMLDPVPKKEDGAPKFWEGTAEEYARRVSEIQRKARLRGLPIPSVACIEQTDKYDSREPTRIGQTPHIISVRRWLENYEDDLTDFHGAPPQCRFNHIRVITNDGETMPVGYIDRIFEQYEAAELQFYDNG